MKYFFALLVFSWLISCTKQTATTSEPKAVVEAYLVPGRQAEVKITQEIPFGGDSTVSYALTGLAVFISNRGTDYSLVHTGDAIYSTTSLSIGAGETYSLKFEFNNREVTATTTIPQKPTDFRSSATSVTIPAFGGGGGGAPPSFPDPVKLNWSNAETNYHFFAVKCVEASPTEISGAGNRRNFTTAPDQTNTKEINFGEFKYYGKNALLLYRVQTEYAALYNTNGNNSQNITTVPTNVQNGLGIFTGINLADTIFITVN